MLEQALKKAAGAIRLDHKHSTLHYCIIMGCMQEGTTKQAQHSLGRTPYLSKNAWSTLDITSSSGLPIPNRHLTSPDIVPPWLIQCPKNVLLVLFVAPTTRCI